ncbi:MAG TPA: transcriptional regulator [Bacillota bacterium]|jgi:predicted transcriptional regulator|nr:transcriptional regulator [Peptococcaceae bacterium MAG4]NLW37114.1 transcriptional regulator [Peptococcaceae bacterium]HPZ44190.1 transcriptional regulator [Bacillota bacterium]HQD76784.1 transcriptional regulator [Bacillota bacterium]HUM59489.1 transcriptional regulator [Bacillota bacterium]
MTSTLAEYFVGVQHRLPEEAERVMKALASHGPMNKEELSLTAKVKRAVLDHVIMQLYALGLVDVTTEGKSKMCSVTTLGWDFISLSNAG